CGSTLILPPGTYSWYHPSKLLPPTAREIFNQLALGDTIPRVPETVYRLQDEIRNPKATPQQIAMLLRREPILAADLLQLANVARSSSTKEIADLEHAVLFVGRRVLSDLVLAASLRSFKFQTQVYSSADFWR